MKEDKVIIEDAKLVKKENNDSSFGAIVLIVLGVILLFNNFGLISWEFWSILIRFWPIIFVFIGVDLVFGKTKAGKITSSLINTLVSLFIIIYTLALVNTNFNMWLIQKFPEWKNIKQQMPYNPRGNVFNCSPTGECKILR